MAAARECWRGAAHAALTIAGAGNGHIDQGQRIWGVACPAFPVWEMHEALSAHRNSWSCSSGWAQPAGMLLCPAPLQGLHFGFSVGSGGRREGGPGARHCRKLLWKGPSTAPAFVSGWKPQPSPAPGSDRAGGCGRMSMVQPRWHEARGLQEAVWLHPRARGARQGGHRARLGQEGQHPPRQ